MMNIDNILRILPGVKQPITAVPFNKRLMWTFIGLLIFLLMGQIPVAGTTPAIFERLQTMQMILGSKIGTLATLGIGPIVMASIILQLLVGSGIISWDLNSVEGRARFVGVQKLLAFFFCFFEAAAWVLSGALTPKLPHLALLLIFQLAIGGIIILFLDELISKWGIGSGVSLFIAAGVSQTIFVRLFSWYSVDNIPAGEIPRLLFGLSTGNLQLAMQALVPIISTIAVFLLVVYANGIKVEVPLAFASFKGFGRRWPLNFFYTSNIPVIFAAALLANIHMWGAMLYSKGIPILGEFDERGQAISGLAHLLSPPHNLLTNLLFGVATVDMIVRGIFYSLAMIILAIIFSVFWVNTSGMDARSVARQIESIGMQVPGFRRDPRILEKVLDRYIMPLAVLGGAAVGALAALADFMGALGTGTGILLTVMIIYNLYENLATRYLEEMNPMIRKFFEIR